MNNKFLLLAAGAYGLYYVSGKKSKKTIKDGEKDVKDTIDDIEEDIEEDVEPIVTDDDIKNADEDLPVPLPEEKGGGKGSEDLKIDENLKINFDFEKAYELWNQSNNEQPTVSDSEDLWISDSCLSWALGKDFSYNLPQKLVMWETETPDDLISPLDYWEMYGSSVSPQPWYLNNLPNDPIAKAWASNLIEWFAGNCDITVPRRQDYDSYQDYAIIISKFVKTPIGQLWAILYSKIEEGMFDNWALQYPTEAADHIYSLQAIAAVKANKGKAIDDQTNIAYWASFDDEPKKLDPNNPEHTPYIKVWTKIKMYVKEYRSYVKTHGY